MYIYLRIQIFKEEFKVKVIFHSVVCRFPTFAPNKFSVGQAYSTLLSDLFYSSVASRPL